MTEFRETQENEAAAAFVLGLRARGIRDLAVLRAMEAVPRARFAPAAHAALAGRGAAVPIPCGQTMSEPFQVARMLEGLGVTADSRVLEVGTGSGYATAVLARLGRDVLGVERFKTLVRHARERLDGFGVANVRVEWGDGLGVGADVGPFDRILVHARLDDGPAIFAPLARPGAVVVCGRRLDRDVTVLVRHERTRDGWSEIPLGPAALRPPLDGVSTML